MAQKASNTSISYRKPRHRIIEDFVVVWLDSNISETDTDYQNSITQLQHVVSSVSIFTDPDQCVDFLTDIMDEKAFLIVSDTLGYQLVSLIQDLSQLQTIYVFDEHKSEYKQWVKDFNKVKGIFDQIKPICDTLKKDIRQSSSSLIPISIINSSSSNNSNELDQSFMYTQLLKDILLKMENDDEAKRKLVEYCRLQYEDGNPTLNLIEEFDQKYPDPSPIWWYTRECFYYSMLNKAFRIQDVEVIIKMGFFARDLHRQIEQLYSESNDRHCFTVYRGQGILNVEFTKISRSKGVLLSFNNFLSTSTDRAVANMFAESALENSDLTGILFRMEIDPSISSTPFASTDSIGYYSNEEDEILFSMHTIFRIGEIEQIDDRLWEVHLTLTSDNDEQLTRLTEYIRENTDASTGLHRLGSLMFVMGEFDKAEEIFKALLETTSNEDWTGLASLHHMLGYVNHEKGNQSSALTYFKQSQAIELTYLPSNDPKLCRNYSGIGLVLKEQDDLDGALEYFQRSLEIELCTPHPKQLNIATHHNNIGGILDAQGKYDEALKSYKRTLEIELMHLPEIHPSLATTYINIAGVYDSLDDSLTALSYYKKALEIQEKSLPSNHPWLATNYMNIADTYDSLDDSLTALSYYKKALEIQEKSLPSNHPELATTHNNIATVYDSLEDSATALFYYEKALKIQEKSSLSNDPELATVHFNIAKTLEDLHRYREAIIHAAQAVDIVYRAFGPDHSEVKENQKYLDELRQKL
jgi:tetratricopeptide (TPR) repeat protein